MQGLKAADSVFWAGPLFHLYTCKWHSYPQNSLNWGLSHSLLHSNPCSQQLVHRVFCSFYSFGSVLVEFSCINDIFLVKSWSQSSLTLTFSASTGRTSIAFLPVVSSATVALIKMLLEVLSGLILLDKDTSISLVPMATAAQSLLNTDFSATLIQKEKKKKAK